MKDASCDHRVDNPTCTHYDEDVSQVADLRTTGQRLQADYLRRLRDAGHVLVPLTPAELKTWRGGLSMPGFAHICMDGDVVVGEKCPTSVDTLSARVARREEEDS